MRVDSGMGLQWVRFCRKSQGCAALALAFGPLSRLTVQDALLGKYTRAFWGCKRLPLGSEALYPGAGKLSSRKTGTKPGSSFLFVCEVVPLCSYEQYFGPGTRLTVLGKMRTPRVPPTLIPGTLGKFGVD